MSPPPAAKESSAGHAFLVAAGILISRIAGLVRQRVFLYYFGLDDVADAFNAAFRVPNFLQNLFGEGVLSASFIPVYARLLAKGEDEESGRLAGAIGAILAVFTSLLVLLGVLLAPWLMVVIAPGYHGAKRELTILLVRILFPGAGLLVFSAWCLGILNSHRRFFLSYTAPVIWNAALIATLLLFGRADKSELAVKLAWGSVAGSALQFAVQLPAVLSLARGLRLRLHIHSAHVREVLISFTAVFVSRGVVQISGYIDQVLASLLGTGALAGMTTAQSMYMLPVSLFGMSVSAAELPAMSSVTGGTVEVAEKLRRRLNAGLRQIAFFIVPSAMAFFALGDVITGALYQSGRFQHGDTIYVWAILAGSAVGLLAGTMARLYASTYYALRDTRTPMRFAIVRVLLTSGLGYLCSLPLTKWLDIDPRWGAAGLTASAGVSGWVEFTLLRRALIARIGNTGLPAALVAKLWGAAALSAAAAWGLRAVVATAGPIPSAMIVLGAYGVLYFAATYLLRVDECVAALRRLSRLVS